MGPREERIQDVAAVQLANRQQVHGGGEHSDPGGPGDRVQVDVCRPHAGENRMREDPLQPGDAEFDAALMRDVRNHLRKRKPDGKRRQQKDEARKRSGDSDVEQHPLGINRRAYANERAESAEKWRGHEVRQARVHAVVHRRHVMAELMSQQNRQQGQRKRQSLQQDGRMPPGRRVKRKAVFQVEGQVPVEIRLHRRTRDRRGDQGQKEKQAIKPIPLTRASGGYRVCLRRPVFGEVRVRRRRVILRGHDK